MGGNMSVNTPSDEYEPSFLDSTMFYAVLSAEDKIEKVYRTEIIKNDFVDPRPDKSLPLHSLPAGGVPSFYSDTLNNRAEIYFAATNESTGRTHRDIYFAIREGGLWSAPIALEEINSPYYESHPTISPDGNILMFTSDRPGSIGDIDIWISRRGADGIWSDPALLPEPINTADRELSPYIGANGNLYYASRGFGENGDFQIIRAHPDEAGSWTSPEILPAPVNSPSDETGPAIYHNYIYFASNRPGGMGGYDIYRYPICKAALIRGEISLPDAVDYPADVALINISSGIEETIEAADGHFENQLNPGDEYELIISHDCFPGNDKVFRFHAECSDNTSFVYTVKESFRTIPGKFTFEKYDIPFFVTGYYKPNTTENLSSLRLKFDYGLLGISDSTRYIEDPGERYNQYVPQVESALSDAMKFILKHVKIPDAGCGRQIENLHLRLRGYSDPREISSVARFAEESIDDEKFGFRIDRGAKMNNRLLSSLRAYYTARYLERRLREFPEYRKISDKVRWEIMGEGVDRRTAVDNEYKRRVMIEINPKK